MGHCRLLKSFQGSLKGVQGRVQTSRTKLSLNIHRNHSKNLAVAPRQEGN